MQSYELQLNQDHYTVMANNIITGKQCMSCKEAKLIRLLVTQIVKEDKDFKTYKVKITKLANFLEVDKSNLYREVKQLCDSLMTKIVKIETGNPEEQWETLQWLQKASYDGKGTITLMLSNQIQPYLIGLNAWFTQYKLKNILAMKSFYSIRIYELLKLEIGKKRKKEYMYDIKYLREYLNCEKKLKQIGQFKERVLNVAVKEISEFTEYIVKYSAKKSGRTITDIVFSVTEKELKEIKIDSKIEQTKEEENNIDIDDLIDELHEIILEPLKIRDLKAILKVAGNNLEVVKEKYKLSKMQEIENLTAWLIKAIEEDYHEPVKTVKKQVRKAKKQVNTFNNFSQREYTAEEMEEIEKRLLQKSMKNE